MLSSFVCDNCARPDDVLVTVQRVYVLSRPHDSETTAGSGVSESFAETLNASNFLGATVAHEVLDDIERWCPSCTTQYPHVPVVASP